MADERSPIGQTPKSDNNKPNDPTANKSTQDRSTLDKSTQSKTDTSQRAVSGEEQPQDVKVDHALRPKSLDEMIGQDRLREKIKILVQAARQRGEALDHVLLYGPPGLGKTTMSFVLAHEMQSSVNVSAGPAIEKAGDLAAILTNLRKGDILFIDEIHRLRSAVEEVLYPAMEDFSLNIVVGSGPGARSIQLKLPKFTVVGATTRLAMLTSPLRARFGVVERFDFYEVHALQEIVTRASSLLNVPIEPEGALEIAKRSRGTPRVALRLLRRVRDYAQVLSDGKITKPIAEKALAMQEVDALGLDELDRRVLESIMLKYGGGPVGLDTLAASISEEGDTIMDVVEPYLLQLGFLDRTPRGRVVTKAAYDHMQIDYPDRAEQRGLFG